MKMKLEFWKSNRLHFWLLVIGFGFLAAFYGIVNPAWEAPDEPGHLQYVLYLRQQQQLPVQTNPPTIVHAYHPPLYYALVTLATAWVQELDNPLYMRLDNPEPVIWQGGKDVNVSLHYSAESFPARGQVLMLQIGRLLSAIFGMGTVAFVYLAVATIFPERRLLAFSAALLVTLNPQFLFLSGSLNNDTLLTCTVSGAFWSLAKVLSFPERIRNWWLLGFFLALGILTKLSGVVDAFAILAILSLSLWLQKRWQLWLGGIVLILLLILCVDGWYFVRNWQLYGDPLGWSAFLQYNINPRETPMSWSELDHFFTTQFNSFWGLFGWMNVWAPTWFYQWVRILSYVAIFGFCLFLINSWRKLSQKQKTFLVGSGFAFVLHESQIIWGLRQMNESWYQGRYLFPMFVPLSIVGSCGILQIFSARLQRIVVPLLACAMLSIALYIPVFVIAPTYQKNALSLPAYALWVIDKRMDINFNNLIRLRGYTVRMQKSELEITLYWQAIRTPDFNYSAFVHLLTTDDSIAAQQDHAPGETDGYPPIAWRPEDIVADTHVLPFETNAPKQLRIGLYNWQSGIQLPILNTTSATENTFILIDIPS